MGDRALIILKARNGNDTDWEYSPVCYLHWHAPQVQNYINRLKEVMEGRPNDLSYSFARLCGIIHNDIDGNLSFGVWNFTAARPSPAYFEKMSHGDGGVYVVNIATYEIECYGGYGLAHQNERDGGDADRKLHKEEV